MFVCSQFHTCQQAAIKIDPEYGEVYFNYGNLLSDEGNFAAAVKMYVTMLLSVDGSSM